VALQVFSRSLAVEGPLQKIKVCGDGIRQELNTEDLEKLKDFLTMIKPRPAVFNKKFVEKLDGSNVKGLSTHREHISALKDDIEKFKGIPPSQLYAYTALSMGISYLNGAPNLTVDFPAMVELSKKTGAVIAGKDFKTGQTFIKTVIAPSIKARLLKLHGWFSTNILGNRDGEVLDDPRAFKNQRSKQTICFGYNFRA